jgi:hypothetical protein
MDSPRRSRTLAPSEAVATFQLNGYIGYRRQGRTSPRWVDPVEFLCRGGLSLQVEAVTPLVGRGASVE